MHSAPCWLSQDRSPRPLPHRLRLGVAAADITPQHPLELAGFASRTGPYDGVRAPLEVQAFAFVSDSTNGPSRVLLVCADLLWWGPETATRVARVLSRDLGIDQTAIILHASHTHCGPQTTRRFATSLGTMDERYINWLESQVRVAARAAFADLEPVTVQRGWGTCDIGINRRRRNRDGSVGGPDPEGPADHELTVLRFSTSAGRVKAVLVHYACHPVATGDLQVSPDFPGAMRSHIQDQLEDRPVAAYLQGCCGDINPRLIRDGSFYQGGDHEVWELGAALAEAALATLRSDMTDVPPSVVSAVYTTVDLPLTAPPSPAQLAAQRGAPGRIGEWSRRLMDEPERMRHTIPLRISHVTLAEDLSLLCLAAEVTVPYGLFIKERFQRKVLPLPYSNGMLGYVVTAEQLAEGGYESDTSRYYFILPAPFSPDLEERIKRAIDLLVARNGGNRRQDEGPGGDSSPHRGP